MIEETEAHAHLAALIASSDDAIISKDLHGNITSWNPSAEKLLQYKEDEVLGRHISIIIPPAHLAEEEFIIGKIRKGERVTHFETVRRAKNGNLVNLAVTVSPIKSRDGRIIGASKIARDITELKRAERSNAYLSAIIQSSDDAIISKDLNGVIKSWNPAAERMFGYTSDEAIGKHVTLLIPSDRLEEEDKIISALRNKSRIDHFETIRQHKNGSLIPVSLTVSPIIDSTGTIIGASKVARDISDRVRAQVELAEMSRRKDEFIGNMSHELRTPLNAVIGLASLLQSSRAFPEKERKMIDVLKVSADHLLELINDLLDFAKIESGHMQLEEIEFDIVDVVEKTVNVMLLPAQEKGLNLSLAFGSNLVRYQKGDPLRVQQILMNLLSNAVKFTQQGVIEVFVDTASASGAETVPVTIEVRDTGIGIPKGMLGTIFDKFMQVDSSITRRFGGSGLGLAIVNALVKKMGGTIDVRSDLGVGSTFSLMLPFKKAKQVLAIRNFEAFDLIPAPGGNKNILLVEDYAPNILVTGALLDELGYGYDVAQNGFEALKKYLTTKYDLILMDIQMHELDGFETTRKIRKIERERRIERTPIVALTAHVREQDKNACMQAGMDDFIPKPFHSSQMSRVIARHIKTETSELAQMAK